MGQSLPHPAGPRLFPKSSLISDFKGGATLDFGPVRPQTGQQQSATVRSGTRNLENAHWWLPGNGEFVCAIEGKYPLRGALVCTSPLRYDFRLPIGLIRRVLSAALRALKRFMSAIRRRWHQSAFRLVLPTGFGERAPLADSSGAIVPRNGNSYCRLVLHQRAGPKSYVCPGLKSSRSHDFPSRRWSACCGKAWPIIRTASLCCPVLPVGAASTRDQSDGDQGTRHEGSPGPD
jgi:hypothetical protein